MEVENIGVTTVVDAAAATENDQDAAAAAAAAAADVLHFATPDNDGEDTFGNAEEREADLAHARRIKRQRRLETAAVVMAEEQEEGALARKITTEGRTPPTPSRIRSTTTSVAVPQPIRTDTITTTTNVHHPTRRMDIDEEETAGKKKRNQERDHRNGEDNTSSASSSDSSGFDMFGDESPSSTTQTNKTTKNQTTHNSNSKHNDSKRQQDGFDDAEGYYKATIGEIMEVDVIDNSTDDTTTTYAPNTTTTTTNDNTTREDNSNNNTNHHRTLRLRVLGVIGKGVFSSVLKCSTTTTTSATPASAPATDTTEGIPTNITIGSGDDDGDGGDEAAADTQMHRTNYRNYTNPNNNDAELPSEVAVKCIRSNETMTKAAIDELKFLIRLRESPGIVPLLLPAVGGGGGGGGPIVPVPLEYRHHTLLVFPYYPYNLRDVLQKFGKGVGLSLHAVQNYFGQLLSAATHLQKYHVLHCDIKPDNILVTADFTTLLLADFGSASEVSHAQHESYHQADRTKDNDNDTKKKKKHHHPNHPAVVATATGQDTTMIITPYLVSRFYRAPEIILGIKPITYSIDLWSIAVTAGELFLGKVLLNGTNNNDMLYVMMQYLVRMNTTATTTSSVGIG